MSDAMPHSRADLLHAAALIVAASSHPRAAALADALRALAAKELRANIADELEARIDATDQPASKRP